MLTSEHVFSADSQMLPCQKFSEHTGSTESWRSSRWPLVFRLMRWPEQNNVLWRTLLVVTFPAVTDSCWGLRFLPPGFCQRGRIIQKPFELFYFCRCEQSGHPSQAQASHGELLNLVSPMGHSACLAVAVVCSHFLVAGDGPYCHTPPSSVTHFLFSVQETQWNTTE